MLRPVVKRVPWFGFVPKSEAAVDVLDEIGGMLKVLLVVLLFVVWRGVVRGIGVSRIDLIVVDDMCRGGTAGLRDG